jgi:heme a synthase
VAGLAFLLLIAGGLVTSNNAGLAVPDWPTSFGSIYKMPRMVGGVKFEHGHRMLAEFTGFLTIVVAIWTWRLEKRRWMRGLTLGAVAGVIFQGVLGGLTVLNFLPPAISVLHATVGQTMFCVLAAIAVFTSGSWLEEPEQSMTRKEAAPLLRHCWMLIGFLYLQLILGAAFRHVWTKWGPNAANRWPAHKIIHTFLYPHLLNSLLVSGLILYVSLRVIGKHATMPHVRLLGDPSERGTWYEVIGKHATMPHLRRPAMVLLGLLILQLLLGFSAFITRVIFGIDEIQPTVGLVITTVAHLAGGALLLAVTAILTIQAYRHTSKVGQAVSANGNREAVGV